MAGRLSYLATHLGKCDRQVAGRPPTTLLDLQAVSWQTHRKGSVNETGRITMCVTPSRAGEVESTPLSSRSNVLSGRDKDEIVAGVSKTRR